MLILSRRAQQQISFPGLGISIRIVSVQGQRVRIGVEAPPDIAVIRTELAPLADAYKAAARPTTSPATHTFKNRLNGAILGLHLAQRQLAVGAHSQAEESLLEALQRLADLESGAKPDRTLLSRRPTTAQGADILLVEDDLNEQSLLRGLLELEGYAVHVASNGLEALKCLERITPRFVLLDMQMPRCDGKQTCERIRSRPHLQNLPVYAVSAASPESVGLTMGRLGVDHWFPKPLDAPALMNRLRQETLCVPM